MNQEPGIETTPNAHWWRHPHVWLVIAGPAAVVVASMVTAVIAVRGADKVITEQPLTPAVQGRNHAAAPQVPRR